MTRLKKRKGKGSLCFETKLISSNIWKVGSVICDFSLKGIRDVSNEKFLHF